MIGLFEIGGRAVRVDFSRGTCLAIPLNFGGPQPSHFGAAPASAQPMRAGAFLGDTRQGGPCNVPILALNPHCNGTHTESIAHIVDDSAPIHQALPAAPMPATLVTLKPLAAFLSGERIHPLWEEKDQLLTAAALNSALATTDKAWLEALVVRTLPNSPDKMTRRYGEPNPPPFFSPEAVDLIGELGVKHLLMDLPSVDKMHDQGVLAAHHRFWRVPEGSRAVAAQSRLERTITEMIFVPDALADGPYLLDLQIPAFSTDAAPSRPWLFPVEFV